MNVAEKYDKIAKLRALAEHKDTPVAEAYLARRRMDDLERKIRDYEIREKKKQDEETIARARSNKKSGSAVFRHISKLKRNPVVKFPVEWPFGWSMRGNVEMETLSFDSEKKIVLGWKCPSCQMSVEREITPRHRARLQGQHGGVDGFINDIRTGKLNQLCDACWDANQ